MCWGLPWAASRDEAVRFLALSLCTAVSGTRRVVRGGTWQTMEQRNTNGSGLEVKPTLCSVEGGCDGGRLVPSDSFPVTYEG